MNRPRLMAAGRHRRFFSAKVAASDPRTFRRYRAPHRHRLATRGRRLAADVVAGLTALRTSEALLLRRQSMLLAHLSGGNRIHQLGFGSVAGFGEEVLSMQRRTVYDRLALDRALVGSPAAEAAFLDGRLTQCQVLALAPLLAREDAAAWIEKGVGCTVREIRRMVRGVGEPESERTSARVRVSFAAPAEFDVVWREACELARAVLGYQASQSDCLDAMLQETGVAGRGDVGRVGGGGELRETKEADPDREVTVADADESGKEAAETSPVVREFGDEVRESPANETVDGISEAVGFAFVPSDFTLDPEVETTARDHLALLHLYCEELRELCDETAPQNPEDCRDRLLQTVRLLAPLRALTGRLLCDIRKGGLHRLLGYVDLDSFVTEVCGITERTARNRIDAAFALEDVPLLEQAYARGEIGVVAVQLLHRLRPGRDVRALLRRAEGVTTRQLIREYRLLRNLESCQWDVARLARRPLPQADLEEALVAALCRDGDWTRERLEATILARGLTLPVAGESRDPAENPALMKRLELLADLLLLVEWDEPPDPLDRLPVAFRKTSAQYGRDRRFTLWLSIETAADLEAALQEARRRMGKLLPVWVVLTLLIAEAREAWLTHDPKSRPRHQAILKRDGYACQVPTCTRRRNLEVHHIVPRARGGNDAATNRITLCASCHRMLVHTGAVKLQGEAPHALKWQLGGAGEQEPTLRLRGERIV